MYKSLPIVAEWKQTPIPIRSNAQNASGVPTMERVDLWKRNPIKLIKELLQDPEWKDVLQYKPQKLYVDSECSERIYNEMWTGDWWWEMQVGIATSRIGIHVMMPCRNAYRLVQR